uniref:Uncharacterized protein n=1 Tax=Arundo donax TaxID=35708 RepID=A0A0A9DKP1_ARUDO
MLAAPINPSDINRVDGVYPVRPPLPGAVAGYEGVGAGPRPRPRRYSPALPRRFHSGHGRRTLSNMRACGTKSATMCPWNTQPPSQ